VVLSLVALAMLVLWDNTRLKKYKLLPGPLAVVIAGVVGQWVLPWLHPELQLEAEHLVALPTPGSLSDIGSLFAFPDWSAIARPDTWRIAVTLGVVASLETLLSLEATDRIDPFKREAPTDRELAAQGIGNIVAGLMGGLPVTGVIVRSAANVDAGAQTKRSAIIHGVLLLIAVLTIPMLLNMIPLASLAAILIYTGFKLSHPRLLRHAWAQGRTQWLPFLVTVSAILLSDLLVGITIGLAVGFVFILFDQLRYPCFTVVSPQGSVLTRLKLQEQVSFLHKASLARLLDDMPAGARIEIDGTACQHIDHDVLEFLSDFRQTARLRRIDFRTVGIDLPALSPSH
jgi:MFS superfamily sulfate permease-like transporter